MAYKKKVEDSILIESYKRLNNVWLVAKEFNMCGQSVWERLKKLGIEKTGKRIRGNVMPVEVKEQIEDFYSKEFIRGDGKLDELSNKLGIDKTNIARYARKVNLTNSKRNITRELASARGVTIKRYIKEQGHPKGMQGKEHNFETKKILSAKSIERWKNPDYYLNSDEYRQKLSDRMTLLASTRNNSYSRCKTGYYLKNGNNYYMRSSWELKYAGYLDLLERGNQITNWEYETDTFWFEEIKRGVRSYKPDFKIFNNDGSIEYHEVKGWMDSKSITKIKRMAKYYPNVKLVIIDKQRYRQLFKRYN